MFKKILFSCVFIAGSLSAMQGAGENDSHLLENYIVSYNQAYLLGSTAIAKMAANGMPNAKAFVVTMLMKKEQQRGVSADQSQPRIKAFTDLLQGKPNQYAQNQ
jgi:hypothetical protein